MHVRDLMTRHPLTLSSEATLGEAAALMSAHDIRAVPVVDDGDLVGIITDRDLKMALGPDARSLDVDQVDPRQLDGSVDWFMTEGVVTVAEDLDLAAAGRRILELRVGALPVVGGDGELSGILSATDFLRWAVERLEA